MLHSHRPITHSALFAPSAHPLPDRPPRHALLRRQQPFPFPAGGARPGLRAATLAVLSETAAAPEDGGGGADEGPIELPPSSGPTIFSVDDNPTPLQVSTSVLLTGAISVFLFRSLRRRAKRAKELRVRSSGVKKAKDLKTEALDSLKAVGAAPLEASKPPSPAQAFLAGIAAGVIALILYKFTVTIEAALNRQAISDNFSVRQITITVRTIVNGLCYLATFVFGVNSVGLVLYAGQLVLGSIMGNDSNTPAPDKDESSTSEMAPAEGTAKAMESRTNEVPENSEDSKTR